MSHIPNVEAQADGSTEILNGNLRVTGGIGVHGSDPDSTAGLASGDGLGNTRLLVGKDGGVSTLGFPAPVGAPVVGVAGGGIVPANDYLYALAWTDPITTGVTALGPSTPLTVGSPSTVGVSAPTAVPAGVTQYAVARSKDGGVTWYLLGFSSVSLPYSDDHADSDPALYQPWLDNSLGTMTVGGVAGQSVTCTALDVASAVVGGAGTIECDGTIECTLGIAPWNATPPAAQPVLATGTGKTADDVIALLQSYGFCKQS